MMAVFSTILTGIGYGIGFLGAAAGLSTATILTISGIAGQLAVGAALTAVARALAPKVNIPRTEIQAIISQTDAPRRIYVGQNLAAGIRALYDVRGNTLYQLVVVSHGPIAQFLEFWVDGERVNVSDTGGVTSGDKSGYVTTNTRDGRGRGGNYAPLLANFSYWGDSRRLQGQTTFLVRSRAPKAEDFSKVFPKAYNTDFQWVIRGQEIYDPRTNNTSYSANAPLVIAHYLQHPDGFKLSRDEINWESVAVMADVSDQTVPQLGGGTAPNLRLWGWWTLDEDPNQVLQRMHTSSGIRAYEMQNGQIGMIGGPFGEPACTLTAKDIEQIETKEAISEREGYNVLQVFHLSAAQKYEVIEVESWRDEARLAIEGEIVQEYKLEMCPNRSQARRLAKKQIHDDNRQKVTIITNLVGLKARWPRFNGQRHTILLDYRPEDGSGRVIAGEYEVLDHEFDPIDLKCRIELGRVNRASEAWTAAEEGETTADLPVNEGNPAPPLSAVLSQRILQTSASVQQPILEVAAVPIVDRDDLSIQAEYRLVGTTAWLEMGVSGLLARAGAIEDGEAYEARIRWRGVFDGVAPWVNLGPITIQIDSVPPGQATEFLLSNGTGHIRLNWRNPPSGFFEIRIYRGLTTVLSSATLLNTVTGGASGQISEYLDTTAVSGTTYSYWVRAANVSGVEGTPTGPGTITKT